jgi:glycyl-tRNA synthetase beta chain
MPDLILELGTEEIPAGYLPGAIEHLRKDAAERLKAAGLACKTVIATATPRRLVLFVEELPLAQPARTETVLGPPEKAAWKDGQPTPAAKGFAEKNGLKVEDLVVQETPKGRYIVATKTIEGRRTSELLPELLHAIVKGIAFPKSMRWPQAPGVAFPRPIRRLLAIYGREPLALEIAGQKAGRGTVGHPFLTGDRPLALDKASYTDFRALLRTHHVIVDRNERRAAVERGLDELMKEHGAKIANDALLEEVTDLVELPEVVAGAFDEKYLRLPREVVEAAMTDHQRYFPLTSNGKLLPKFAFVMNRPKEHAARVREGNERVLRARLEDASFYLEDDLKTPLRDRVERLDGIIFQEKLGTMRRKAERLAALASFIADTLAPGGATAEARRALTAAASEAALLAKADLTTEMVREFPQLQGAVGARYAAMQGHAPEVAEAIREHYLPRGHGDELPRTPLGAALALAEKLDNLCGFFSLGLVPTGSQDPYALRRQAAGVARILMELGAPSQLIALIGTAAKAYDPDPEAIGKLGAPVFSFIVERVRQGFLDQGHRHDIVDAVLAPGGDDLGDVKRRLEAVTALSKEPFFADLVEVVERTFNISKPLAARKPVDAALLTEPAEKALAEAWAAARPEVESALAARDWARAARRYVEALKAPVHEFMAKVLVHHEDPAVRDNRMSLLREIWAVIGEGLADLSRVAGEKK